MTGLRRTCSCALPLALLCFTAACGSDAEGRPAAGTSGPTLAPVDSILLSEDDTLYIGHPRAPTIDPFDGSFYISDTFGKRVLRFDRDGELLARYGGPGGGPGEYEFNGLIFVLDDSTVVVVDEAVQRFNFYDRQSGEFRDESVFYDGGYTVAGNTPPVRVGDDLWFASVDPQRRTALVRWTPTTGMFHRLGPLPREYHESRDGGNPAYANHMFAGSLAAIDSAIIRGWQPRNDLLLYDFAGNVLDTLDIPVVRRRGVPENLRYLYDVDGALDRTRITINSYFRQVHALPQGGLALIHHDQEILSMDGPLPVLAAQVWLGVIGPDLARSCVDTSVPASRDAMPAAAFRGDTLFVLDRRIVDDTRLETWIHLYRIDTEDCDWIPLEG